MEGNLALLTSDSLYSVMNRFAIAGCSRQTFEDFRQHIARWRMSIFVVSSKLSA